MAKIKFTTELEGYIGKYDAYKALCMDAGLTMLIDGTERDYIVEDGVLYRTYDKAYHGSPSEEKEVHSKDLKTVLLFENLLAIKSIL